MYNLGFQPFSVADVDHNSAMLAVLMATFQFHFLYYSITACIFCLLQKVVYNCVQTIYLKTNLNEVHMSRYYWTVDNANLLRFTRRSYHLD